MSKPDTDCASALFVNPSAISSSGNCEAGAVASLSRSRTVLLYSVRLRRRSGESPGCAAAARHASEAGGKGCTPGVPGAPTSPGPGSPFGLAFVRVPDIAPATTRAYRGARQEQR